MVSFYIYDIAFLILFTVAITILLYKNKKNMAREGIMYLYRGNWGIKKITSFEKRFHKVLTKMKYLIITVGYGLMITMMYLILKTVWLYISRPEIAGQIKAPPIAPLIPYFPELFGLTSFFPPFYFTYFILSISIVMIVHEFSHGIFMKLSKTKIKSTGIVFLGPILGAFVEQDDKSFHKKSRLDQMTILGAGVFANLVTAIIFYLLYIGFFALSFNATGVVFSNYAVSIVNVSDIDATFQYKNNTGLVVGNENFFLSGEDMEAQLANNSGLILAYYDSPAFQTELRGIITQMNDSKIRSTEDIRVFLENKAPGDTINITTSEDGWIVVHYVKLGQHPNDATRPFIGISYPAQEPQGNVQKLMATIGGVIMSPTINYETTWDGNFVFFILHLLWWVMIINFLVALFNMLPLGILDGGRFFYLTVEKITNKKIAEKAFKFMTKFILGLFLLMMLIWAYRLF